MGLDSHRIGPEATDAGRRRGGELAASEKVAQAGTQGQRQGRERAQGLKGSSRNNSFTPVACRTMSVHDDRVAAELTREPIKILSGCDFLTRLSLRLLGVSCLPSGPSTATDGRQIALHLSARPTPNCANLTPIASGEISDTSRSSRRFASELLRRTLPRQRPVE